jgi:hypothetical protein
MPKKESWTLEKVRQGLERFYKEHSRYPTSREIDLYEFLPTSKTIQRKFGGLVMTRKELKTEGPDDFRKGSYSSERATIINKRAHEIEKEVYTYLSQTFGREFVHREYFFSDDRRTRTDFFVYCKNGNFLVDVFYPKDRYNLIGCLNSKMKTYSGAISVGEYPVFFLMMNNYITEGDIEQILNNKKNKLAKNQRVVSYDQFKKLCASKVPMTANN